MTPERLRQIEELYHSAREHEPGQRAAFLAEACQDDEDLRREVESLLAADPAGACFLDQPVMRQAAGILASQQSSSDHRFAPGFELGPYVIEARLGAGGMGEVYRAKDKRLHRIVALKVLPQRLADTQGLRQRLEREAKVISSLNHPQICRLYDIGRQGDVDYLVMEFLEGDTLARRLERGALLLCEVLELAIQIASALAAAHAAGIVHRDLKPGNIMLTKSGAKLLDFGLAKVRAAEVVPGAAMSSLAEPITTAGTVLGTAQYMSPEQIQGHEADARSDLFAFGATLYEMLSGRKAFEGSSQLSVAGAILEKEPAPLNALQPATPLSIERLVSKCLAKDPENRWRDAADMETELRWIAEGGQQPLAVSAKGRRRERVYGALAVVLFLTAIVIAVSYWRLSRTLAQPIVAQIAAPAETWFSSLGTSGRAFGSGRQIAMAFSPDGRSLAFSVTDHKGKTVLCVQSLDSRECRRLPGTEGGGDPFWSPDGRALGFFADGNLKIIDAVGGSAMVVAPAPVGGGGSWNRDGTILFVPDISKGFYRVPATGGPAEVVIPPDNSRFRFYVNPRFLPDGKHFLYRAFGADPASEGTYIGSLDGRQRDFLVREDSGACFAMGFLLYLRGATLLAQLMDPVRGRLKGNPHPIAEHVSMNWMGPLFAASESGLLVYRTGGAEWEKYLSWFDRDGKVIGVTGEPGDYFDLRLSPDGRKLAVNKSSPAGSPSSEIWAHELARSVHMRLTIDPDTDHGMPIWSPDASRIVFAAVQGKARKGIYQVPANGVGAEQLLLAAEHPETLIWPTSWSHDGKFILYTDGQIGLATAEIRILPLAPAGKPRIFMKNAAAVYDGQFSPNGRWVAYTSQESGKAEVYVVPFDAARILNPVSESEGVAASARWQVSTAGGRFARWRGDGHELFYVSLTNQIMAAQLQEKGDGIEVQTPQLLFSAAVHPAPFEPYDVTPDGNKFVINTMGSQDPALTLLVNWPSRLKTP